MSYSFPALSTGYWIPDLAPRERVKVPVAIKVLREDSSQVASNEILDVSSLPEFVPSIF